MTADAPADRYVDLYYWWVRAWLDATYGGYPSSNQVIRAHSEISKEREALLRDLATFYPKDAEALHRAFFRSLIDAKFLKSLDDARRKAEIHAAIAKKGRKSQSDRAAAAREKAFQAAYEYFLDRVHLPLTSKADAIAFLLQQPGFSRSRSMLEKQIRGAKAAARRAGSQVRKRIPVD